jgi:hypothetical protein
MRRCSHCSEGTDDLRATDFASFNPARLKQLSDFLHSSGERRMRDFDESFAMHVFRSERLRR